MQNEIQVFTNERFGCVRMAVTDGKLRFAGMDVAVAPEYSNPQKAVRPSGTILRSGCFRKGSRSCT